MAHNNKKQYVQATTEDLNDLGIVTDPLKIYAQLAAWVGHDVIVEGRDFQIFGRLQEGYFVSTGNIIPCARMCFNEREVEGVMSDPHPVVWLDIPSALKHRLGAINKWARRDAHYTPITYSELNGMIAELHRLRDVFQFIRARMPLRSKSRADNEGLADLIRDVEEVHRLHGTLLPAPPSDPNIVHLHVPREIADRVWRMKLRFDHRWGLLGRLNQPIDMQRSLVELLQFVADGFCHIRRDIDPEARQRVLALLDDPPLRWHTYDSVQRAAGLNDYETYLLMEALRVERKLHYATGMWRA